MTCAALAHTVQVDKAKKNMRVYFVAGDRLLDQIGAMFTRQQSITASLAVGPDRHLEQIDSMWRNLRAAEKRVKEMARETAVRVLTRGGRGWGDPGGVFVMERARGWCAQEGKEAGSGGRVWGGSVSGF